MSNRERETGNRARASRFAASAWRVLGLTGVMSLAVLAACDRGPLAERAERRQQALGAGRLPADVKPVPESPSRYGVGRPATAEQIRVWDVDIDPDGTGLPQGRGTHADGVRVYALKCAACHGGAGEGQVGPPPLGVPAAPRLIGREPREGFGFGQDPKLVKTVGNYWPYATTVFDYIRRTMPITAPGSLSNSEVYAVVAFILAENEIIEKTAVLDSLSLPLVKMPARDKFVADDRKGGSGFK